MPSSELPYILFDFIVSDAAMQKLVCIVYGQKN